MGKFQCNYQLDAKDCGIASLQMITNYYGKCKTKKEIENLMPMAKDGVSLLSLCDAAETIGFKTMGVKISVDQLVKEVPLPCVLHWTQNHYVVLYKIKNRNIFRKTDRFYIADPAYGNVTYSIEEIVNNWVSTKQNGEDKGIALILEPTQEFYEQESRRDEKTSFGFLFKYFLRYKKYFFQLFLGLILGSIFQLIFPFLTQAVVDNGIFNNNIDLIYLILLGQFVLILSRMSVEFIRRWILLHISARINVSLMSDFFIKLMKLPMSYFDVKIIGDLLQRIDDHERVERFITTQTLNTVFSIFTLMVFGSVLLIYSFKIFVVFLIGSMLYVAWIFIFLKKRRQLDYKLFEIKANEQVKTYQLVQGMHEIKLQNAEKRKRWEWEDVQAELLDVKINTLKLEQKQDAGNILINESKNVLITFIAAVAVVNNEMTLGMMLAAQYIIGQLSLPIEQFAQLINDYQDTKISLERINEIHNQENEYNHEALIPFQIVNNNLIVKDLNFQYEGVHSKNVINQLNIIVPQNKVTAIVGASGSGKTTFLKLLLKYYEPVKGSILVGNLNLKDINPEWWRKQCGVVMQDGYIFSESIARNIAASSNEIDEERVVYAARIANIHTDVMLMPLKYNTIIGQEGQNLSQGQRQRILIARAVYKNPPFLFLDEATNSLDANNEKCIMENLQNFYRGRTVVVVAHRLSTVKNADKIIVLDGGEIKEEGTHRSLVKNKGNYYNLVKNQLELGV